MTGPDSKRRYIIDHLAGSRGKVWSVTEKDPKEALARFRQALVEDGHAPTAVEDALDTWTQVLMAGGRGVTFLTPDQQASTSITITTK